MNAAEHPTATAYRRTAGAFRARDFDAIRSLVAEDFVWHVPGRHSMAGEIRGLDEFVAYPGGASVDEAELGDILLVRVSAPLHAFHPAPQGVLNGLGRVSQPV